MNFKTKDDHFLGYITFCVSDHEFGRVKIMFSDETQYKNAKGFSLHNPGL